LEKRGALLPLGTDEGGKEKLFNEGMGMKVRRREAMDNVNTMLGRLYINEWGRGKIEQE